MRSAQFNETSAAFDLQLSNPGGRDLVVTRLEYSVSHGETSFPVARGAWSGSVELPSHGTATLALRTPFDAPLLEPDSDLLHLNGELFFTDRTGYLGIAAMDLTRTSFSADIRAARSPE